MGAVRACPGGAGARAVLPARAPSGEGRERGEGGVSATARMVRSATALREHCGGAACRQKGAHAP